jgi:hypothetical protein
MNLHKITVSLVASNFSPLEPITQSTIPPLVRAIPTPIKAVLEETQAMVVGRPDQTTANPINPITVEGHFTTYTPPIEQSKPTPLTKNRFGQIPISKSHGNRDVIRFSKSEPLTLVNTSFNSSSLPRAPTANEADGTRGFIAPKMLMFHNNLARTIYTMKELTLVQLRMPTNRIRPPTPTKRRTFHPTADRRIILMTHIINGQDPILILQNSPIQTQTLRKRPVKSLYRTQKASPSMANMIPPLWHQVVTVNGSTI